MAGKIIKYDNNFFKTLDRLCKLDDSFPRNIAVENDNYRLERHLAEALLIGKNAYKESREKEKNNRSENQLNCDIYKIFLNINKIELNTILDDRCEKMVKNGLLNEVGDLIKKKIINSDNCYNRATPGLNAYGVLDSTKLLMSLYNMYKDKDTIMHSIKKNKKSDPYYQNFKKQIMKTVWEFFAGFSAKTRQYARRQATWFRNQDEFLWKINNKKFDIDYIVHDILGIVQKPYEDYNILVRSQENIQNKQIFTDKTTSNLHNPKFSIIKDSKELSDFLIEAFEIVKNNMEELNLLVEQKKKDEVLIRPDDFEDIKKYLI